jgi:hypothetical protein
MGRDPLAQEWSEPAHQLPTYLTGRGAQSSIRNSAATQQKRPGVPTAGFGQISTTTIGATTNVKLRRRGGL